MAMGKKEKKRKSSSSSEREKKEKKKAKKKEEKKKKRSESSSAKSSSEEKVVSQVDVPLRVSGCQNKTISEIVKGTYVRHGSNHGKPVYKKQETQEDEDLDVTWSQQQDIPLYVI